MSSFDPSFTQPSDTAMTVPLRHRDRLTVDYLTTVDTLPTVQEGMDVVQGLSAQPKSLPPKYFYDNVGSQLFEQITALPEYYLTRTETAILEEVADAIATLTGPCELVELGSGSATKTRILLDAYCRQAATCRYVPVDVSGGMLEDSARQLLAEYPELKVHGLVSTYEPALAQLPERHLPARMIAFIGSTLGNLTPTECSQFLSHVSAAMAPGDYFLLGIDLRKEKSRLEAAYNDSQGVTAQFNLNMLQHLNWRFQGNFDLTQFRHVAFYNEIEHQIEIYIESQMRQTVTLKALNLTVTFEAGERLLSEISRKFDLAEIATLLQQFQLNCVQTFSDSEQQFGLLLATK